MMIPCTSSHKALLFLFLLSMIGHTENTGDLQAHLAAFAAQNLAILADQLQDQFLQEVSTR